MTNNASSAKQARISADYVRTVLAYDPSTGDFRWRLGSGARSGRSAGCLRSDGYLMIGLCGAMFFAHRLAWLHVNGEWPTKPLDHVNGTRSDNRIANLREASHSENAQNKGAAQRNNRSGLLGVDYQSGVRKWRARIKFDGKQHVIGMFDSAEEAHAAYLAAKAERHPFAARSLNIGDEKRRRAA